ncbi:COMM domain containing 5 Like Sm protein 4 isoform X2 [Oratosquilla oratoria]|uniref:COMM domain containing 5 Like Sm protein 4 isoform X2 n=1 Tax=Oratosquilla oratoria TaxID=337810 RepID=UPI003F760693
MFVMSTAALPRLAPDREHILFPSKIPTEVKSLINGSKTLEKPLSRKLIKLALGHLQGTMTPNECETMFKNICNAKGLSTEEEVEDLSLQYAGMLTLLRQAFRLNQKKLKQENLLGDLKHIGFPEDQAADICKVITGPARPDIDARLLSNSPSLPTLSDLKWRVDVSISTNWLSRVLEPAVLMEAEASSGRKERFHIPIQQFHQLRFTVAHLLHQMETMEASPVFKK